MIRYDQPIPNISDYADLEFPQSAGFRDTKAVGFLQRGKGYLREVLKGGTC
jgi:hypothetical protein